MERSPTYGVVGLNTCLVIEDLKVTSIILGKNAFNKYLVYHIFYVATAIKQRCT